MASSVPIYANSTRPVAVGGGRYLLCILASVDCEQSQGFNSPLVDGDGSLSHQPLGDAYQIRAIANGSCFEHYETSA